MSDWQPIEIAPKDGTRFIGLRTLGTIGGAEDWFVSDAQWQDGRYRFRDAMSGEPSHWMALTPPTE